MIAAISHRGPDDEGFALIDRPNRAVKHYSGDYSSDEVKARFAHIETTQHSGASIGLAHCRFSIIDITAAAHQPFIDNDGSFLVVFNGEIYNYIELKREFEASGEQFRTASDTEVFLKAFRTWGTDAFGRMNGFWAAAIYDRQKDRLVLCRDRLGKKPLCYAVRDNTLYFASEIKALLAIPSIKDGCSLNEIVAHTWLSFNRKNTGPSTFFKGIENFPQASWLEIRETFTPSFVPYWRLPEKRLPETAIGVDEAVTKLRALVTSSVALRLRADVPVGLELSGGLDSSVLYAAVKDAGSEAPCFTVRFDEPGWNEEPFARAVAEKFGANLQVLEPQGAPFWKTIGAFTKLQEEPYHSPNLFSSVQTYVRMRETGIKVSLNGAGGDECFAGYPGHFWSLQWEHLLSGNLRDYFNNARSYSEKGGFVTNALYTPLYVLARNLYDRFPIINGGFSLKKLVRVNDHSYRTAPILSERLLSDMRSTLMPYWLASGDRTYMGVPLEIRMPFLDYRVMEFAFTLPLTYLIRDGWHKWILRKAYEKVLPPEVAWRRKKMGFPFPTENFLRQNKSIIDLIALKAINPYVAIHKNADPGKIAWRALSFVLWYEYFINGNMELFGEIEKLAGGAAGGGEGFEPGFVRSCK